MLSTPAAQPSISVVLCSRDGAATIGDALQSLARQTIEPDRYEVIVVDDCSRDQTTELARAAGARVKRLTPAAGLAGARNAGVRCARAPIVAFLDDDCLADPNWLAALLAGFADERVTGVGGRVLVACERPFMAGYLRHRNPLVPLGEELVSPRGPAARLRLYLERQVRPHSEPSDWLYAPVGANMAFRRELLLALDGFDEAFRFGSEEEELCLRVHRLGRGQIRYCPDAVVVHRFRPQLRDALRRARSYGIGNARRALKHPDTPLVIFPLPLAVASLSLALLRGADAAVRWMTLALPLLGYPRWIMAALRDRSPVAMAYPYLQLAEETMTMAGEVKGLRAGYLPMPSRHLHPNEE